LLQSLAADREARYAPIRRFPSSAFDLSVLAGPRELVGGIRTKLAAFAGDDLVSIEFLRQYTGAPLPEGTQSVSFRLTVAAKDGTLSSDDVAAIRTRIIEAMRAEGHELRV
jgi:phenylalanyl-tRNA synthetase beta chain